MNDPGTTSATRSTEVIGSYGRYAEAQRVIDTLSDRGFPVEHTAIVGEDLRLVEDVTGRKRYGRAALEGAGTGAVTGLIIGLFLSIFTLWETVVSWFAVLATWTLLGAVVGAVLGAVTHALHRGRRDFSSDAQLVPGRYDVVVAADRADEARRTAELEATTPADATEALATTEPTDTGPTTAR